ncbi:unnamed protein product [Brachionus calyciflorus]|uniref:Cathepsin propeptide inhibitor domain-containing protein n=1 Tax=Brachionus calyciflorus TaxID=104777 RepID=A0A813P2R4_9BILA|nr:unnamed protein product [Brachionus calyciflorus]
MKILNIFLVMLFCLILDTDDASPIGAGQSDNLWQQFKSDYKRNYQDQNEEQRRYDIFRQNVNLIEKHNQEYAQGKTSFTMGINDMADWTKEEFQARNRFGNRKT